MEIKKILSKIAAVMADVGYIQKDAKNEHQKYRYASERVIKEKLHESFVKHGITMQINAGIPTIVGNILTLPVEYVFYDVESGEFLSGNFVGAGHTRDEKAVYAAMTGAIKYLLTSTFLIPTGDDPEDDRNDVPAKKEAVRGPETPTMGSGTVTGEQWDYITKLSVQKEIPEDMATKLHTWTAGAGQTPQDASEWIDNLKALPNKAKLFDPKTFVKDKVLAYIIRNIDKGYPNGAHKANALTKYVGGESYFGATDEQLFHLGAAIKRHIDEQKKA